MIEPLNRNRVSSSCSPYASTLQNRRPQRGRSGRDLAVKLEGLRGLNHLVRGNLSLGNIEEIPTKILT